MPTFTYRKSTEADLPVLNQLLADAFTSSDASDIESITEWTKGDSLGQLRTFEAGGAIVGTTRLIEMGQFFGGTRVNMTGIAGVTITPEARATGAGRVLMDETLKEMRANGTPISTLYASTSAFYRKCGYETAGLNCTHRVPIHLVPRCGCPLTVRPYEPSDQPAVEACYERSVRDKDGSLSRTGYIWDRVHNPKKKKAKGYVFLNDNGEPGAIEGYIFHRQEPLPNVAFPMLLFCTDLCATTPAARDTLFSHIRGYSSMCHTVEFDAGPSHPIALALAQQRTEMSLREHWMLRVVDVGKALQQRGYPRAADAELCFELTDNDLPENAGVWTLTVASGKATVEQGGTPTMAISIRALAALYTGYASARDLRTYASLACEDEATLVTCDALFRGPTPGMGEMF